MSSKFDTHQILQAYEDLGLILDTNSKDLMVNFLELYDSSKIYEQKMKIGSDTKDSCVTHNLVKYILDGVIRRVRPEGINQSTYQSDELMNFSLTFDHRGNEIEISTECEPLQFDRCMFYRIVLQVIDILERDRPRDDLKISYLFNKREYKFVCQHYDGSDFLEDAIGSNISELLECIIAKLKEYNLRNDYYKNFKLVKHPHKPTEIKRENVLSIPLEVTPIPTFFFEKTDKTTIGVYQITNFDAQVMHASINEDGIAQLQTHTKDINIDLCPIHTFTVSPDDGKAWLLASFKLGRVFNNEHKYIIIANDNISLYDNSTQTALQFYKTLIEN